MTDRELLELAAKAAGMEHSDRQWSEYDDIIRMARKASGYISELPNGDAWLFDDAALERFAALVAAAEREFTVRKCLEVCEAHDTWTGRMVGDQIKYLLEDKP